MSIQEIANFLVEWEYNEDTYLDVTYAALSLFKKDKDCLYAYANSYSPFITHLLEVYEKRQEYSPDKYLIHIKGDFYMTTPERSIIDLLRVYPQSEFVTQALQRIEDYTKLRAMADKYGVRDVLEEEIEYALNVEE